MDQIYDINLHITKKIPNSYGGSEKKWSVLMDDGARYMLKFPDPVREKNRELSYMNNAFSEYIGCNIYKLLGVPVQETKLGIFKTDDGKEKIACLCKDIREQGDELIELESLRLELIDNTNCYSFPEIENLFRSVERLDYAESIAMFYDMFIVDSLIGNPDRHAGNCSILIKNGEDNYKLSPVYDCGSCLSPLLTDEELTDKQLLNDCYNIKSAIRNAKTGQRLSYREYLYEENNPNMQLALMRIVPQINLEAIHNMISDIPYISDKRKNFYINLIDMRYKNILLPALGKALSQTSSKEYKMWSSKIINDIYSRDMQFFVQMENAQAYECSYPDCSVSVLKMNDIAFIISNDNLIGFFDTNKTNKNVANFVTVMKKAGLDLVKIYNYPTTFQDQDNNIDIYNDVENNDINDLEK